MGKDAVAMAVAILFVLSGSAAAGAPGAPAYDPAASTIRVSGKGSVQVEPNTATIRIGVTTEKLTATEAVSANTSATSKVISELEAAVRREKGPQDVEFLSLSAVQGGRRESASARGLQGFEHSRGHDPRHGQGRGHLDQGRGGWLQSTQIQQLAAGAVAENCAFSGAWTRKAPCRRFTQRVNTYRLQQRRYRGRKRSIHSPVR